MKNMTRRHLLSGLALGLGTALAPSAVQAQSRTSFIRQPEDVTRGDQATITRVPTTRRLVAMTFDDGPHPRLTPVLLDVLKARGIRATFYVIGQNVRRYPQLVGRMVAEGHEIGNHTHRHPRLSDLGVTGIQREIDQTSRAVFAATGKIPVTMRPPYGAITMNQRKMVYQTRGLPTVLWSVDPQDWRRPGSDIVAERIVDHAHRGAVILAHDIHRGTIRAMPTALDGLIARQFQFATVSELLGWPRWDRRQFRMDLS